MDGTRQVTKIVPSFAAKGNSKIKIISHRTRKTLELLSFQMIPVRTRPHKCLNIMICSSLSRGEKLELETSEPKIILPSIKHPKTPKIRPTG